MVKVPLCATQPQLMAAEAKPERPPAAPLRSPTPASQGYLGPKREPLPRHGCQREGRGSDLWRLPIAPWSSMQVDGKEFHYFLSHKKEHSKHGSVPGHVALNLHDSLQLLGFRGWCEPYP